MSHVDYFRDEFQTINSKDLRLTERSISIGETLFQFPGSCIQAIFPSRNAARCAYDFFSNPKVEWRFIFAPHQEKTVTRIQEAPGDFVYVIQDSTFYNYSHHKAKTEIGTIGKQGSHIQFGFLQHSSFCLSEDDIPLGLIDVDFIGYEDEEEKFPYRKGFPPLASSRWRHFLNNTKKRLVNTRKTPIILCDREADFFELLNDFQDGECCFVIRSKWDRYTGQSARHRKNKFSSLLKESNPLGKVTLPITDPHTHQETLKDFTVKSLSRITVPPNHRGAGHRQNSLKPIEVNIVEASDGKTKWVLLTDLPVENLKECIFVVEAYKKRWHIESFHKVLKTAYKAEQIFLHSSREAVQNLLTMINIAAYQTYKIIHLSRAKESLLASAYFTKNERKAALMYLKNDIKNLKEAQTLKDMYQQIAILGGLKNTKNKHPPGILTIYRGIKRLYDISKIYKNVMSTKT